MRTASICPTCPVFINADCIVYNGAYLSAIGASPLQTLSTVLGEINSTFPALSGAGVPNVIAHYVGQFYLNTLTNQLYIALSATVSNWGLVGSLSTTTSTTSTTTTAAPTTTTTTTTIP